MYNVLAIQEAMRGLVGFEPSYNPSMPVLTDDMQASSSGLRIGESFHPLLTPDNILAIAQRFFPGVAGDRDVAFNDWLSKRYDASVVKLISRVFTEKKLNEAAKTLLANVVLFEGVGNVTNRITKSGRFVGYKLKLKHQDTVAILTHIGLQVDTIQNPLNVYLYHSSSPTPLQTFALNHSRSIQMQWHKLATEITLATLNDDLNGGVYYLGYYESDLLGSAIRKEVSFSGLTNCYTCTEKIVNRNLYQKWSPLVHIQPFYVNSIHVNDDKTLWDSDFEIHYDDTTFGLNLQLTVQCDVTGLLVKSKAIMAGALAQQIKVDLLSEMTFSLRDNQVKQKVAAMAAAALDNPGSNQYGEIYELSKYVKALSFDLSKLSDICLACETKGYKMRSLWNV